MGNPDQSIRPGPSSANASTSEAKARKDAYAASNPPEFPVELYSPNASSGPFPCSGRVSEREARLACFEGIGGPWFVVLTKAKQEKAFARYLRSFNRAAGPTYLPHPDGRYHHEWLKFPYFLPLARSARASHQGKYQSRPSSHSGSAAAGSPAAGSPGSPSPLGPKGAGAFLPMPDSALLPLLPGFVFVAAVPLSKAPNLPSPEHYLVAAIDAVRRSPAVAGVILTRSDAGQARLRAELALLASETYEDRPRVWGSSLSSRENSYRPYRSRAACNAASASEAAAANGEATPSGAGAGSDADAETNTATLGSPPEEGGEGGAGGDSDEANGANAGCQVRIVEGPMAGLCGCIASGTHHTKGHEKDGMVRIEILMHLLGQTVSALVPLQAIEYLN